MLAERDLSPSLFPLSSGRKAQLSCLLEVFAQKPGNVHWNGPFLDMHAMAFVLSATAVGKVFDEAGRTSDSSTGVGRTVYAAVEATRGLVQCNTNLGILLLLAPLAVADGRDPTGQGCAQTLPERLGAVLNGTTRDDADWALKAIRLAQPSGLGCVPDHDVHTTMNSQITLQEMMAKAAEYDAVARQYITNYQDIFRHVVPAFHHSPVSTWEGRIQNAFLRELARQPDTLIVRKQGWDEAERAQAEAQRCLAVWGHPDTHAATRTAALQQFDQWLRTPGTRRNPGTTADLIASALYVALSEREPAFRWPSSGTPAEWMGVPLLSACPVDEP